METEAPTLVRKSADNTHSLSPLTNAPLLDSALVGITLCCVPITVVGAEPPGSLLATGGVRLDEQSAATSFRYTDRPGKRELFATGVVWVRAVRAKPGLRVE